LFPLALSFARKSIPHFGHFTRIAIASPRRSCASPLFDLSHLHSGTKAASHRRHYKAPSASCQCCQEDLSWLWSLPLELVEAFGLVLKDFVIRHDEGSWQDILFLIDLDLAIIHQIYIAIYLL